MPDDPEDKGEKKYPAAADNKPVKKASGKKAKPEKKASTKPAVKTSKK